MRVLYDRINGYDAMTLAEEKQMQAYCEAYKDYLDKSKTERLCVAYSVELAEQAGFTPYREEMDLHPGDKLYSVSKDKNLFLAVVGKRSLKEGANISVAHADSPHLDVRPCPLYEEGGIAYFKTYLYGWVRKHHWMARPLAMHGVVILADGSRRRVDIGEAPTDPQFLINDLLPHLGREQNKKPLGSAIPNHAMNIVVGSRPLPDSGEGERIKAAVMELVCRKYGFTEADLFSAELELVPAGQARDVGFDRSFIAAYGQDDRSCGYAQLRAILETEQPERTAVCVLIDKEEVNSNGVTGMKSRAFDRFMKGLCRSQQVDLDDCYARSFCLSADVTAAYDPNFQEVYEAGNAAYVNHGVAVSKYTGHDGDKSDASDASAEVVGRFRAVMERNGIVWQMSEMGDPAAGGGGTIAKFMANRNIDTLDAGVPVLSMHAPCETTAKLDCYMTYRAVKALYGGLVE